MATERYSNVSFGSFTNYVYIGGGGYEISTLLNKFGKFYEI